MNCCCAGTDHHQAIHQSNGTGEELLFSVSSLLPCKDVMFPHQRTKSCDLLSQLPSSIPLDSGYNIAPPPPLSLSVYYTDQLI